MLPLKTVSLTVSLLKVPVNDVDPTALSEPTEMGDGGYAPKVQDIVIPAGFAHERNGAPPSPSLETTGRDASAIPSSS